LEDENVDKTLQEQLTGVEALLEQEKAKGPQKDADVIARLEQQQADVLLKMDAEKAKVEQEAAQKVVIQTATVDAAYFLDNLVIEGLTMRQLTAGESEYQMLRIGVQSELISRAEKLAGLQKMIDSLAKVNEQMSMEHGKLILDKEDAESKRDAAMAKVDGLELLVSEKQAQIDILRNEIAVGAQQAYKVVDLDAQAQQMKELADKIKASRIHVYDVVPDNDINPKNFTAKRVDNGESITYNWTQENNYIVLKDEAEVSRFRDQHATQAAAEPVAETAVQDTTLVTIPEALHVSEGNIPSQTEVPTPDTVASGVSSTDGKSGETVTAEQLETRLAQFAVEHGLVQQQAVA
jgi:hypothetical protein